LDAATIVRCVRRIWTTGMSEPMNARRISTWAPGHVFVACVLWMLGAPVLAALGLLLGGAVLGKLSGSQKFSFTVSLTGWATGVWLFVPPIVLVGAWLWSRKGVNGKEGGIP
jgi:hypothetical protein